MNIQTVAGRTRETEDKDVFTPEEEYPVLDVVSLPLPRKRVVATLDIDIELASLPKRLPHIVAAEESEDED